MGTKVSDKRQVPVCFAGHRYCEQYPLEVKDFLEKTIWELNARYRAEHPLSLKKARRVKKDPLYVVHQSVCGQRHTVRKGMFWCPRIKGFTKVG